MGSDLMSTQSSASTSSAVPPALSYLALTTQLTIYQDSARRRPFQLGLHPRTTMVQELSQLLGWMVNCNHMASDSRRNCLCHRNAGARTLDIDLPNIRLSTMARYPTFLRCPRFRLIRQYISGSTSSTD